MQSHSVLIVLGMVSAEVILFFSLQAIVHCSQQESGTIQSFSYCKRCQTNFILTHNLDSTMSHSTASLDSVVSTSQADDSDRVLDLEQGTLDLQARASTLSDQLISTPSSTRPSDAHANAGFRRDPASTISPLPPLPIQYQSNRNGALPVLALPPIQTPSIVSTDDLSLTDPNTTPRRASADEQGHHPSDQDNQQSSSLWSASLHSRTTRSSRTTLPAYSMRRLPSYKS